MKKTMFRCFRLGFAFVLSVGATTAVGCMSSSDSVDEREQEQGTVHWPLVTPTQDTYRLHNATFVLSTRNGTTIVTLDSESDPDAEALSAVLMQGSYNVHLEDGWELDSVAADGTESIVQAALLSHNPQAFEIRASANTEISFTFTTGEGTVVIGDGSANINIDVASSSGLTACQLLYNYSCDTGQKCMLADSSGRTSCAAAGSLPVGSPCSSEQCVAGSQCLKPDLSNPDQGFCTQFCNSNDPPFGCACVGLGIENSSVGICGPTPAEACDLLTQTGCEDGEACQYLGGSFGTCGVPGSTPPGASCSGESCLVGYQCYSGVCREICDTRRPYNSSPTCSYCYNVGTGFAGRCIQ